MPSCDVGMPFDLCEEHVYRLTSVASGGNLFFHHCLVGLGDLVRNKIAISKASGPCLRDKGKP